jgi:hypothetical protein
MRAARAAVSTTAGASNASTTRGVIAAETIATGVAVLARLGIVSLTMRTAAAP